ARRRCGGEVDRRGNLGQICRAGGRSVGAGGDHPDGVGRAGRRGELPGAVPGDGRRAGRDRPYRASRGRQWHGGCGAVAGGHRHLHHRRGPGPSRLDHGGDGGDGVHPRAPRRRRRRRRHLRRCFNPRVPHDVRRPWHGGAPEGDDRDGGRLRSAL
ncbi:MAG: hypothetical protein AVDCRST_MAG19-1829, partial [uncultured Thermomicrobiales bacterium]